MLGRSESTRNCEPSVPNGIWWLPIRVATAAGKSRRYAQTGIDCRFDVCMERCVCGAMRCLSEVTAGNRLKPVLSLSSVGRCRCVQAEIGDGTPEARTLEVSVSNEAVVICGETAEASLRKRREE